MRTVLALSVLAVAAASQALVIDDFSDGNMVQSQSALGLSIFYNAATVPGGVRTVGNDVLANGVGLNSTVAVTSGVFAVATDPLVNSLGAVAYGLTAAGPADLNLDLSGDGAFTVDVLSNDISADLVMQVVSSTNGVSNQVVHTVGPVAYGSPITVTFNFSDFGIAMNDVDQIELDLHGVTNNDIIIDNLQTAVPEPATLVFGFAALTALAAKRRRKALTR